MVDVFDHETKFGQPKRKPPNLEQSPSVTITPFTGIWPNWIQFAKQDAKATVRATEKVSPETNFSAHRLVYEQLLGDIRSGVLASGQRVKTETVAAALGVSRMPVREAIRQLASEGFLLLRPNRGAIVRQLSQSDVRQLFEMRGVLEGFAMRFTALAIDLNGLDEAKMILNRLDRSRREPAAWVENHNRFHDVLDRYCGRPRLIAEIVRLRATVEPYLRMCLRHSPTAEQNTTAEHRELLEVIAAGDPDSAERAMRDHVTAIDLADFMPPVGEHGEHDEDGMHNDETAEQARLTGAI